jgi:hypothetical protein
LFAFLNGYLFPYFRIRVSRHPTASEPNNYSLISGSLEQFIRCASCEARTRPMHE